MKEEPEKSPLFYPIASSHGRHQTSGASHKGIRVAIVDSTNNRPLMKNNEAVRLLVRITLKHLSRCIENVHIQFFHDTKDHSETFHKPIHCHPQHPVRCGFVFRSEDGFVTILLHIAT